VDLNHSFLPSRGRLRYFTMLDLFLSVWGGYQSEHDAKLSRCFLLCTAFAQDFSQVKLLGCGQHGTTNVPLDRQTVAR
jgi:hypothetical protein